MNTTTAVALHEALDYLRTLSRDNVRPTEAHARLRLLRERHPATNLELLWEEEAFDASVHYDLLLRADEQGTTSLSYCPDRALPWPLRGAHRWSDQDLLRVNHTRLPVSQAVACLDFMWDQAPVIDRLVNVCLIQEELEREPITLSDAELQLAMDGFRRARRLFTAQDTRRWMERRGVTHTELEALVSDEAMVAKLRQRIAEGRVEDYFETHRADFESAHIARIAFASADEAQRAAEQVRGGGLDFYALAERQFSASSPDRPYPAAFDIVRRSRHPASVAEPILAALPGKVVGPLENGDTLILALIVSRTPAQLDALTCAAIERLLFEEWLEERRAQAHIEWFWWNATRTRATS
jgi:putative peptide maturation system protein